MGMNETPAAQRVHIGFFGKRNAGKSSVVNAVTGQDLAVVSNQKGTTTDPVYKSMELLPLGPVVIMDTPGIDDDGELGLQRVKKSYQVLNKTDMAVLVIDGSQGPSVEDVQLLRRIKEKKIPCLVVMNKEDLLEESGNLQAEKEKTEAALSNDLIIKERIVWVSAVQKTGIYQLKEQLAHLIPAEEEAQRIVGDLLSPSDFVVLVVPIDKAAPKGRLILPQQQTIRDILDSRAAAIVVKDQELETTLKELGKKPRMVITDSQVFAKVSAVTPSEIPLTSFSILFARYKGNLETVIKVVTVLESLKDGDHVLISEGCTHHRQCDDIGSVKIPKWIQTYTKKELVFEFTSGTEFPEDVSRYRLIVHCGGCMLNEREMKYRLSSSSDQQVPITNYGILIAYIQGILKRSLMVFPELPALLEHPLECREDE